MRKILTLTFYAFGIINLCFAQNVINPYRFPNYSGEEMPKYTVTTSGYTFDTDLGGQSGYQGEYVIDFFYLWWFQNSNIGLGFLSNYHKSYKLEVLGFPFMMGCLFNSGGCADNSTTTRILEMPNVALINNHWNNVKRLYEEELPIGKSFSANNLVTNAFNSDNPITSTTWKWFPHTLHKYTIYFHCGNNASYDIVDSLVFIYDHTRGRMRDYPFMPINDVNSGGAPSWDVRFFPRLIYKEYGNGHEYTETTNEDIYIRGKTLNYYPVPAPIGNCLEFIDPTWWFYSHQDNEFYAIRTAPYCLTSFHLYSGYSKNTLAGYKLSTTFPWKELLIQPGIKHTYTIQNNYDITEINSAERFIYNPPEVDIIANNLFFPSGYTFKTIRGVYPVLSEVALSMGADGNYHDLRDVPVYTDLTGEDVNDATNDNPPRAAKYYIKSNGKLTIEPCVTIYDATFLIESGGILVFQRFFRKTVNLVHNHLQISREILQIIN
jgi:hypothetical protein